MVDRLVILVDTDILIAHSAASPTRTSGSSKAADKGSRWPLNVQHFPMFQDLEPPFRVDLTLPAQSAGTDVSSSVRLLGRMWLYKDLPTPRLCQMGVCPDAMTWSRV